jgi:hypothetical protein
LDEGSARRKAATYTQNTNRINAQTSMLRVGFEPTNPVFERANTVHALDCAATGVSVHMHNISEFCLYLTATHEVSLETCFIYTLKWCDDYSMMNSKELERRRSCPYQKFIPEIGWMD